MNFKFSKSLLRITAMAGAVLIVSCQQQAKEEQPAQLISKEDSLNYAYGVNMALFMKNLELNVSHPHIFQGFKDVQDSLAMKMTEMECQQVLQAYQREVSMKKQQEQQAAQQAAAGPAIAEAQKFFDENGKREGVVTLPSGLQYEVLKAGSGAKPGTNDRVRTHYKGTFLDGSSFDSSYDRGAPADFGVTQVIPGWTQALQLMSVGAKWKVFIPYQLAYGPQGRQGIPPYSALVFEMELLAINP